MGIIYKVTYKIDPNVIYIGQSVLSIEERRRQHERNPNVWQLSDESFDKILLNKGLDNWKWEIIETNIKTKEELDRAEIDNIRLYRERGYKLLNIIHNSIRGLTTNKSNYGAIKTWDTNNKKAHTARYLTGKIKPVINLTKNIKYRTIIELRNKERISTASINKLCETGEPHPLTGNQYAFLDLENNPILNYGHAKPYPILQKIEMLNIKTGEKYKVNLFEAASIANCNRWELTKMKIFDIGGKRDDLTCNGYMFFALTEDGERIETDKHKQILARAKLNRADIYVWLWNKDKEKWDFLNKVKGYQKASEFLAHEFNIQKASSFSSKIIEIIEEKRKHLKGYSFTITSEAPNQKPIQKRQPVILLDSHDGQQIYFDNANKAAETLGLDSKYIVACCNGKSNMTGGYRFAWSNDKKEPIYTEQHENYLRKKIGLGMSVYWEEGDETFQSIAELKRHLDNLCANNDTRVPYVPKAEKLSKIAKGEISGLLGKADNKFKITLKLIK